MIVRAVLFDLDGTLVDSLDDLADAVNHMLAGFGRPGLATAEIRPLLGKGTRNLVQQILGTADNAEIEEGLAHFLEYNRRHIADKSRLYPGARETLEMLAANTISLAAISNKNEALSRLILEELRIDSFFETICGGDTFEEMKPSPLPLLKVVEYLTIPASCTVMVGDSINDVQAGIRAGITTIGCSWGYGDLEELREADHVAASCYDVARLLLSRGALKEMDGNGCFDVSGFPERQQ
jgi:phosphoglycolate phosphatase